jgi:hypothetical protein
MRRSYYTSTALRCGGKTAPRGPVFCRLFTGTQLLVVKVVVHLKTISATRPSKRGKAGLWGSPYARKSPRQLPATRSPLPRAVSHLRSSPLFLARESAKRKTSQGLGSVHERARGAGESFEVSTNTAYFLILHKKHTATLALTVVFDSEYI